MDIYPAKGGKKNCLRFPLKNTRPPVGKFVENSREDLNLRLDDIIMPQMIFAQPFERY